MIVKCFGGLSEMCPDGKIGYMAEPTNTANRDAIFKFYNNTDHEEMQRTILEEKYSLKIFVENILKLKSMIN
ncbi:MAG: hypothetical protein ACJATI_000463 [Halioglobus sp.]|jgi:hypothetical protein